MGTESDGNGDGEGTGEDDLAGTISWRELLSETTDALTAAGIAASAVEARWMVEEATGLSGAELLLGLDDLATVGGVAHLDAMVGRRAAGEPIQYVLGHWAFRSLDLLVDRRVLIPRPETEQVVEVALRELDRVLLQRPAGHQVTVVDLGTGSGAIALSIALERKAVAVWAVDRSPDAIAVARANLAALGMAAGDVRLAVGSWFEPVADELRGQVDLVVSNPPYVAADEELDPSVADWEPREALVPGPVGLEAYEAIVAEATGWLGRGGVLVLEIGATQAAAVMALAEAAGFAEPHVHLDLAGLPRTVVAHRPA